MAASPFSAMGQALTIEYRARVAEGLYQVGWHCGLIGHSIYQLITAQFKEFLLPFQRYQSQTAQSSHLQDTPQVPNQKRVHNTVSICEYD